ncbi:MAG TPA: hypothetical protein PK364_08500 [Synergistaceae bacterium]|nr:hypothetical protein [Synergistaceae bacterium]
MSSLYPEDYRIGAFLRRSFPGSSVAIEGRAPVVEYLAGDTVNFVSLYDFPSSQYMLRPFFFLSGENEEVLAHTSHWLLIRKKMSP